MDQVSRDQAPDFAGQDCGTVVTQRVGSLRAQEEQRDATTVMPNGRIHSAGRS